ncbi:MAG: zinc-ribbon domain containing protein [Saezia sp.]
MNMKKQNQATKMKKHRDVRVPVDRAKLSEASQRSYGSYNEYYEDIPYTCAQCSRPSVFTADEQKYAFEVQKRYMWQKQLLCVTCHEASKVLRAQHKKFAQQWIADKDRLQNDKQFMTDWLVLLEEFKPYRVKNRVAPEVMIYRLQKLLAKLE